MAETIEEAFHKLWGDAKEGKCDKELWMQFQATLAELQLDYDLGKAVALEAVPPELSAKAGEAFANNQDDRAQWLRGIAAEFKQRAQAARADYYAKGGTKGK